MLTKRNLAAAWANLRAAGAPRLILVMVGASLEYEMPHLREAVPEAEITTVRLHASEMTLLERLRHREVGSGFEHHRRRAVEQASFMAREEDRDGVLVLETTNKSVPEVAREVLRGVGW